MTEPVLEGDNGFKIAKGAGKSIGYRGIRRQAQKREQISLVALRTRLRIVKPSQSSTGDDERTPNK
jgi:hypothetical protein